MGPKRLAKNTLVVLVGQVLSMALSMAVIIYFARMLGEEGFGIFSFLIAFTGIFAVVADFGLGPILVREVARKELDPGLLLGTSILLRGALALIGFAAINVVSLILGFGGEMLLLTNIMMANVLFSSKLSVHRGIFESIFRVNLKMEIPVLLSLLDGIVLLTLALLLVQSSPSLLLVVAIYTVSNMPGFVLLVYLSVKQLRPRFSPSLHSLRFLVKESAPLALYLAVGTFYDKLDVLCLKIFTDDVSVGVYSAAMRLTSPLNFLPLALAISFFPLVSRYYLESEERVSILYTFAMKTLVVIGLAIAIYVTFTAGKIIEVLYAGKFSDAVIPLVILMWAQLFVFLNFFQVDFNIAVNRQTTNSSYAIFLLAANLILNIALIPQWGILGASIAKLVTVIGGTVFLTRRAYPTIPMRVGFLRGKVILFGLLFSLLIWFLDELSLLQVSIISGLAFLVMVYFLRIYNSREIDKLRFAVSSV